MASAFEVIAEEFIDDMDAIRSLIVTVSDSQKHAKVRIAAANSTTLLLAATFEEFVREMAREYARAVVTNTESFEKLPPKLASSAWKRTMDGLSKLRFDDDQAGAGTENVFGIAQARFTVIYDFCKGDLTQDIYRDLIHNENNMRPSELNNLFKVSGLRDVCKKLSDKQPMLETFGETESGKAHGKLTYGLEDFFERRNAIAHALNPGQSNGSAQIDNDINMLESFGKALCETLDALAPKSAVGQPG
ncbi:MAG: MAE_28990/MAE_18760 family HEPN-like nuclease [Sulfuriferula sp.]